MVAYRTVDVEDDEDERDDERSTRQQRRAQKRDDEKLLKKALDCWKQSNEAMGDQRKAELADLEFDAGKQWPDDILDQWTAKNKDPLTGRNLPPRPTLTIPLLDGPVQQVINAQRKAAQSIIVKPRGQGATKRTAEAINGLIRHIQVESRGALARGWAYNRAVKCGRGYYRVLKEYANDGDFDMDLVIRRILNQASVYIDPHHIEPDGSDASWYHIVEDLPAETFKREHPRAKLHRMSTEELRGVGDGAKHWLTFEGESTKLKSVRRSEYWYVTERERTLILTEAGFKGFTEDRPKDDTSEIVTQRTVQQRVVKWVKMTATEILDREEWEGRFIPIVQVIGREFNVNGKRSYKGMISNAKDAGRSYNYMRSKQVEAVGLAPVAPYTMVEGQDEGYEDMWATANTVPYARLIYKPINIGGKPAPPPQRNSASTDIGAITQAAVAAHEDVNGITGFSDPSRGRSNPADRSGAMITALQQRTDEGVSDYLDNLTEFSMVHEGRILLDLLPFVYDTPGRVATILDEDLQTSRQVMLNQHFLPPQSDDDEPTEAHPSNPDAVIIDLRTGVYRVVVSTGKSWKTQRDEAVAMLSELISAAPQTAPLVTDVLVENIDAPGFTKLAKRFKAMLPKEIQALEAEGGDAIPPVAAAQIGQLQQQLQQQGQQMQQMQQTIEQKRIETEAKAAVEKMRVDAEREVKLAELAMKERLELAKLQATGQQVAAKTEAQIQQTQINAVERRVAQESEQRHDAIENDVTRAHEETQAELDRAVERDKIKAQRSKVNG